MTTIEQIPAGAIEPEYWLFVPSDPLPEGATATELLPLVIFGHSYTVRDPGPYLGWIEHLVRRGAVVLYPEYEEDATDYAGYRQNFLDDVRSALDTLQRERVAVDLRRVAVTGHSLGGVLAADYAASAAAAGLPVPAAVMSVAPGCPPEVECLIADLGAVPATTYVLLVVEADDSDPLGGGTVERIWSGLQAVPLEQRDLVRLVSDTHGVPWLLATHDQPKAANPGDATYAADAPDALDWYGTWKWLDALMGCAFAGRGASMRWATPPSSGTWARGAMGCRSRRRLSPTSWSSRPAAIGEVLQHGLSTPEPRCAHRIDSGAGVRRRSARPTPRRAVCCTIGDQLAIEPRAGMLPVIAPCGSWTCEDEATRTDLRRRRVRRSGYGRDRVAGTAHRARRGAGHHRHREASRSGQLTDL